MKEIWKIVPALAPALAVGGVTVGVATALGGHTVPAHDGGELQIVKEATDTSAKPMGGKTTGVPAAENTEETEATGEELGAKGSFDLKDGTYEGTGKGYKGDVKVSVGIKDRSIEAVEVVSHSDDEAFFNRAKEGVISSILLKQSVEVDAVSGATYSSNGIINAVKNALTGEEDNGQPAAASDPAGSSPGGTSSGSVPVGQGDLDYADGTYEGSAAGFSGTVRVSVTVKDRTITAVNVLSHSDDASFFNRAKDGVINSILSSQRLDVDTVAGATFSSNGIINAVKDALSRAGGAAAPPEETPTATPTPKAIQKVKDPAAYKDGTYTGTGTGFAGDITVKVKIAKGKIKKIQITKTSDDDGYIKKAETLLDKIVKKQSTNVDAVSGATYSSNGIIEAVRDALSKAAVTKTETTPVPTKKPTVTTTPAPSGAFPYPDGTYTGSGKGYHGMVTVKVVIKAQTIASVEIAGHDGEDDAFFNKAKVLADQIVEKQNVDLDAISGATRSSNGILDAVRNALEAAKGAAGTSKVTPTPTSRPTVTPTPSPAKPTVTPTSSPTGTPSPSATVTPGGSASIYKDGSYTGTALCMADEWEDFYDYDLSLTVVLKDGKIVDIQNVHGQYGAAAAAENDMFVNAAAKKVVSQILEKNSIEGIDAASGATCSSIAIVEACRQALKAAETQ